MCPFFKDINSYDSLFSNELKRGNQSYHNGWKDRRFFLCFFFIFFLFTNSFAQKYITNFTNYSTRNGLSDNFVLDFSEDTRGFVWISTRRGVNRFDGKDFMAFYQNNDENNSHCVSLAEDVKGNMWVAFFKERGQIDKGINVFIIDKGFNIIELGTFFGEKMPFQEDEIFRVHQVKKNIIYLTLKNGQIYRYDGRFKLIIENAAYENAVVSEQSEGNGIFKLITEKSILTIDTTGQIIDNSTVSIKKNHPANSTVSFLLPWSKPYFESGFFRTLYIEYRPDKPSNFFYENAFNEGKKFPGGTQIARVLNDGNLNYCIINSESIILLDDQKQLIYDFSADIANSIPGNYFANRVFFRKNQIWFANNNGFCILNYKLNPFDQYLNKEIAYSTRGILKLPNDNILVVAYRKTVEINEKTGVIMDLPIEHSIFKRGVIEYDSTSLIFGVSGAMINHYDLQTKQSTFINMREEEKVAQHGNPLFIPYKDSRNNVWLGSFKGLLKYDAAKNYVTADINYNEFPELQLEVITYLQEEKEGIWLGTTNGLYVFQEDKGVVNHFAPLPDLDVRHYYREGDIFWLATLGNGLVRWNLKTDEVKVFGKKEGFLDTRLMAVYPDNLGNLWLSSEYGLIRFNKETGAVQTFLESDGITHNEFNISSHFQAADGKIYMGGLNGITAFYPEKIKRAQEQESPFIVTDYYHLLDGEKINKTGEFKKDSIIQLYSNIASSTIHFSYLNYKNADNTRYAYKIDGLENDWFLQNENFIRLNRIPFGKYTLRIKAQDYTSNWIGQELAIPIEVIAPFYRRLEWQLLGLGLLFGIFFLAFQWRLHLNKLEQEKLEALIKKRTFTIEQQKEELNVVNQSLVTSNETKDRLFAILGHDLRNPVLSFQNLSKSLNYLLKNQQYERIVDVGIFLEKQAQDLYHLLDNLLNWALSQRNDLPIAITTVNISELVATVLKSNQYLSEVAEVELQADIPKDLSLEADNRILETVFRNLISNAFRFTKPGGWVKISATKTDEKVIIHIADNGIGMSEAKLQALFNVHRIQRNQQQDGRFSLGLHLCRELIELIDGKITVTSKEGVGTTFTLTFFQHKKKDLNRHKPT